MVVPCLRIDLGADWWMALLFHVRRQASKATTQETWVVVAWVR